MAFGYSPLIDNFNRTNANISGSTCSDGTHAWSTTDALGSTSNFLACDGVLRCTTGVSDRYITTSFGPDVEVYATITDTATADGFELFCRGQSMGTASRDGYVLGIGFGSGVSSWQIRRWNPYTEYNTTTSGPTLNVGDKVGFEVIGTAATAYHDAGGTGSWSTILTASPTDISGAGPIGVSLTDSAYPNVALDDFGGGAPGGAPTLRNVRSSLRW